MTIIKTIIPATSLLNRLNWRYDYIDSFQSTIADNGNKLKPANIGEAFFSSAPKWVEKLFSLRNKVIRIFGLKTSGHTGRRHSLNKLPDKKGDRIGLFKVFENTDNEIILGEDDKHLNFRISFFLKKSNENETQLTVSTMVIFKNLFGRLYFQIVKPFHQIIVPAMLRSMMRSPIKYENKTSFIL